MDDDENFEELEQNIYEDGDDGIENLDTSHKDGR
jgi:hypothetical protein